MSAYAYRACAPIVLSKICAETCGTSEAFELNDCSGIHFALRVNGPRFRDHLRNGSPSFVENVFRLTRFCVAQLDLVAQRAEASLKSLPIETAEAGHKVEVTVAAEERQPVLTA